jgi:hypothetical protein
MFEGRGSTVSAWQVLGESICIIKRAPKPDSLQEYGLARGVQQRVIQRSFDHRLPHEERGPHHDPPRLQDRHSIWG